MISSIFYKGLEFTNEVFKLRRLKDQGSKIPVGMLYSDLQNIDNLIRGISEKKSMKDFGAISYYSPYYIRYLTSITTKYGFKMGLVIVANTTSFHYGVVDYNDLIFENGGVIPNLFAILISPSLIRKVAI